MLELELSYLQFLTRAMVGISKINPSPRPASKTKQQYVHARDLLDYCKIPLFSALFSLLQATFHMKGMVILFQHIYDHVLSSFNIFQSLAIKFIILSKILNKHSNSPHDLCLEKLLPCPICSRNRMLEQYAPFQQLPKYRQAFVPT